MSLTTVHRRLVILAVPALARAGLTMPNRPARAAANVTFPFINNGNQTIWVGALGNAGHPTPNGGGWAMAPKATMTLSLPGNWGGRFWGRTGCTFNGAGQGHCDTGDCGLTLQCSGRGGEPPATLAGFTLQPINAGASDISDVSFVERHNLPTTVKPGGGSPAS